MAGLDVVQFNGENAALLPTAFSCWLYSANKVAPNRLPVTLRCPRRDSRLGNLCRATVTRSNRQYRHQKYCRSIAPSRQERGKARIGLTIRIAVRRKTLISKSDTPGEPEDQQLGLSAASTSSSADASAESTRWRFRRLWAG